MQLPFFSSLLLFSYCIAYFFPPQEGFEALQPSNARRRNPNPSPPSNCAPPTPREAKIL